MGIAGSIIRASSQLTPRERDVMAHVAGGLRVQQISDSMGVSVNTVKFHMKNIYAKLGAQNRKAALELYGATPLCVLGGGARTASAGRARPGI